MARRYNTDHMINRNQQKQESLRRASEAHRERQLDETGGRQLPSDAVELCAEADNGDAIFWSESESCAWAVSDGIARTKTAIRYGERVFCRELNDQEAGRVNEELSEDGEVLLGN